MAIQIISKNEKNVYRYEDSELYYRRVPANISRKINAENTKRGIVDVAAAGQATLEYAITGWKGIVDESGEELTFDTAYIEYLPDEILIEIANRLREASPERVALGN